jgi:hypothetical protein
VKLLSGVTDPPLHALCKRWRAAAMWQRHSIPTTMQLAAAVITDK